MWGFYREKALMHSLRMGRISNSPPTGADHCQHDNPTIGQEYIADWLADVFGIDERAQQKNTLRPIY